MSSITATAEGLRAVREAKKLFLFLWEIEHYEKTQALLDHLAHDMERSADPLPLCPAGPVRTSQALSSKRFLDD